MEDLEREVLNLSIIGRSQDKYVAELEAAREFFKAEAKHYLEELGKERIKIAEERREAELLYKKGIELIDAIVLDRDKWKAEAENLRELEKLVMEAALHGAVSVELNKWIDTHRSA